MSKRIGENLYYTHEGCYIKHPSKKAQKFVKLKWT